METFNFRSLSRSKIQHSEVIFQWFFSVYAGWQRQMSRCSILLEIYHQEIAKNSWESVTPKQCIRMTSFGVICLIDKTTSSKLMVIRPSIGTNNTSIRPKERLWLAPIRWCKCPIWAKHNPLDYIIKIELFGRSIIKFLIFVGML